MVLITHVRLSENGYAPEHIIRVRWKDTANSTKPAGEMDIDTTIAWIDSGNRMFVTDGSDTVEVLRSCVLQQGAQYIKTRADPQRNATTCCPFRVSESRRG